MKTTAKENSTISILRQQLAHASRQIQLLTKRVESMVDEESMKQQAVRLAELEAQNTALEKSVKDLRKQLKEAKDELLSVTKSKSDPT